VADLDLQKDSPLFLIFYNHNYDIRWEHNMEFTCLTTNTFNRFLKSLIINVEFSKLSFLLTNAKPNSSVFVLYTSNLFAPLDGIEEHNRHLLVQVCKHLQIQTWLLGINGVHKEALRHYTVSYY
jgi:hypothetical protein